METINLGDRMKLFGIFVIGALVVGLLLISYTLVIKRIKLRKEKLRLQAKLKQKIDAAVEASQFKIRL